MKPIQQILAGTVLSIASVLGMVLLDLSDITVAGSDLIELAFDADDEPAQDPPLEPADGKQPVDVPEPDMLVLMGLGTLGAGLARCLRRG